MSASKLDQTNDNDLVLVEDLCKWVDGFNLSRPKRDLNRDFSDGYMVAEIISQYQPYLVEIHNYTPCHDLKGKIENWQTLKNKVFKKLGISLSKTEIDDLANWRVGAIEQFLKRLKDNLERKNEDNYEKDARTSQHEDIEESPAKVDPSKIINALGLEYKNLMLNNKNEHILDMEVGYENEDLKEVFVHYDRINQLESKLNQLKVTLKAKDKQIQFLETQFGNAY